MDSTFFSTVISSVSILTGANATGSTNEEDVILLDVCIFSLIQNATKGSHVSPAYLDFVQGGFAAHTMSTQLPIFALSLWIDSFTLAFGTSTGRVQPSVGSWDRFCDLERVVGF